MFVCLGLMMMGLKGVMLQHGLRLRKNESE